MGIERAKELDRRLSWTTKVRPMAASAFVADRIMPDRRTIVQNYTGLSYFIDPLNNLGKHLVRRGMYEEETESILRANLTESEAFLDVGANEGYFSVIAASVVGPHGYIAAVEPQSRLCDLIRINLALNHADGQIFHGALGGAKGDSIELHLSPSLNTGSSSLMKRFSFTRSSEKVDFVDPVDTIGNLSEFAFVKVDVEGFEYEVVKCMKPMLEAGRVRKLLLDYHEDILRSQGIEIADIERTLFDAGMRLDGKAEGRLGYRLYTRS